MSVKWGIACSPANAQLLGDSVEDYLAAIGNREITCVKGMLRLPKSPITLRWPGTYIMCREQKLKALNSYLTVVKYLSPIDRPVTTSCLWHPDLHQENIFVNPEHSSDVVAISIGSRLREPLFNQVRQPYFLDYEGPPTQGLERPTLPSLPHLAISTDRKLRPSPMCARYSY